MVTKSKKKTNLGKKESNTKKIANNIAHLKNAKEQIGVRIKTIRSLVVDFKTNLEKADSVERSLFTKIFFGVVALMVIS